MRKHIYIICGLFILLSLLATYPLILKINDYIPGFYSTDEPFAALWNFWWLKYAYIHNLSNTYYSTIAAPFGHDIGRKMDYPLWHCFYKWLCIITNNAISYNAQVLLSFILSGITMYYLVFYLIRKKIPSLFAGVIYLLCPYHFARAWQHLGLVQIQWMPFYILALIKLKDNPNYKNMLLGILGIFLVLSFEFHYAYFMYICTILFLLYTALFYKRINGEYLRLLKLVSIILLIGLFFIGCTTAHDVVQKLFFEKKNIQPSVWSVVRPFEDLFAQSARPLSYFLPATSHPLFGKFTEQFLGSGLYARSLTEHTLYLGWIPLILAFIAFRKFRKNKKMIGSVDAKARNEDFYIGFFVFLAIMAWIFSQPPWWKIGPIKIFMPPFFMYKLLPIIRAYCRFGIVVMLAISVLAGFGLKFVLERIKTKNAKIATIALFFGLVLFEFWNYPPFKVIDVSRAPEAYYWLKGVPGDFTIAEYPLDTHGSNVMFMFYQTTHEKKIINGTIPGSYANSVTKTITRLSGPKTAGILKWMGVKYVLVHKQDYIETGLVEDKADLDMIPKTPGLKFIKSFPLQECPQRDILCVQKTGEVDVYEVVAATPIEPHVDKRSI